MKKSLCILICMVMLAGVMSACYTRTGSAPSAERMAETTSEQPAVLEDVTLEDVSYVLIYNPLIYDENDALTAQLTSLYSGSIGDQIITGMDRADELASDITIPAHISQRELTEGFDFSNVEISGSRAGGMDPAYEVGDVHSFYHEDESMSTRIMSAFECVYAGTSCYIWSLDGSIDADTAAALGEEFDTAIYPLDLATFGPARFTENGGKINILFYPLPERICGFFWLGDLFARDEPASFLSSMDEEFADVISMLPDDMDANEIVTMLLGMNTDHAIININSRHLADNTALIQCTLAHELQHLICASDSLNYTGSPFMRTWLNEAMSAYAEDVVYPGTMDDYNYNIFYYVSSQYRTGQSLYNFDTADDMFIGAYGVACLFSRYLAQECGTDIFTTIHDYWREAYSADITEAESLAHSVGEEFYNRIDNSYPYPAAISRAIGNSDDEWMSKLTLDFYIETLSMQLAHIEGREDSARRLMLYKEISPLEVEGGGRVIVATENNRFTIPGDADSELLYIGLDENFQVVTPPMSIYG